MKTIAIIPVKNEEHTLPITLSSLESFCDAIIVADHNSEDNTINVCKSFSKVSIIGNHFKYPEEIHPTLFECARNFDGKNLILSIDADELLPPNLFKDLSKIVGAKFSPGDQLCLWWVQLWRSFNRYRTGTSVWSNIKKPIILYDNRDKLEWGDRRYLHAGRLPRPPSKGNVKFLRDFPVLHLQWAMWEQAQFKQARYRMLEFIDNNFMRPGEVNFKYSITLGGGYEVTELVPPAWIEGISFDGLKMLRAASWHLTSIKSLFERYDISRFEPLEIWHLPILYDQFCQAVGRPPQSALATSHNSLMLKSLWELWKPLKSLFGVVLK